MFIGHELLSSVLLVMLQNMEELCVSVLSWIWSKSYIFKSTMLTT